MWFERSKGVAAVLLLVVTSLWPAVAGANGATPRVRLPEGAVEERIFVCITREGWELTLADLKLNDKVSFALTTNTGVSEVKLADVYALTPASTGADNVALPRLVTLLMRDGEERTGEIQDNNQPVRITGKTLRGETTEIELKRCEKLMQRGAAPRGGATAD